MVATDQITDKEKSEHRIVIKPGDGNSRYWKDVLAFRELFFVLAYRDIAVRYKQSVIGVLWAVIRPLLTMVVFTVIFGKVAGLPSDGVPYPVMVFTGMLPWFLFSTVLGDASGSIVGGGNMISKIYFPRIILPVSRSVVALIDFAISFAMLGILMLIFQYPPDWKIVFLPIIIIYAVFTAMGPSLLFAALMVSYRDFRYIVPFVIQFGMYVSPVGFSSSVVPEKWLWIYGLNPLVSVIDGFRWSLLGADVPLRLETILPGFLVSSILFYFGFRVFRRMERKFADVI